MRKTRVAIYGGDERNERLEWPDHLDVQLYPYKSPRSADRLKESISSGSIDHLVVLTSYVGHGYAEPLKGFANTVKWPRSPGELSRQLGRMFPAPEPTNPLLLPSPPDSPGTGGGRGPFAKESSVEVPPTVPMFEHTVASPPRTDETLGQALKRILKSERMSQAELCRLLKKPQPTVNAWFMGRATPKDMGPLVDLWPELARFDKERTYRAAPTAAEADVKTAEALKDRINREVVQGVREKIQAIAAPVAAPRPQQVTIEPELAEALAKWRRLKEELEATERTVVMLLFRSGL